MIVSITNGQSLNFTHYGVKEGLSNSNIYFLMQDTKGYIWFCSETGVNRFDGTTMESFTVSDGLADNENFKCFEDSKGRIWFHSFNGKLSYFKESVFYNELNDTTLKYFNNGDFIFDICENKEGDLIVKKYLGSTYVYNGRNVQEVKYKFNSQERNAYILDNGIILKRDDRFYSLMFNRKSHKFLHLYDLQSNKISQLKTSLKDSLCVYYSCKKLENKKCYFLTGDGLACYEGDSCNTVLRNVGLGIKEKIFCFYFIANDLWLGTAKQGVYRLIDYKNKGLLSKVERYLEGISVTSIQADHEGGIWFSTHTYGCYYLPQSAFGIQNFQGLAVNALEINSKTKELIAGVDGPHQSQILFYKGSSIIKTIKNPNEITNSNIKALHYISTNKLLVATNQTVYELELDKNSFRDIMPRKLKFSRGFKDWVSTASGMLIVGQSEIYNYFDGKTERIFGKYGHENSIRIVSIADGGAHGFWFAGVEKLYWYDYITKVARVVAGREVFGANMKDLLNVDGSLWVGTHGGGVFIMKGGRIEKHIHSKNSKMTTDIIQRLYQDKKGVVWAASNKGLIMYQSNTGEFLGQITTYDGLMNEDIKDLVVTDQYIYAATPDGTSRIDLSKVIGSSQPPLVYYKSLRINLKEYKEFSKVSFPYFNGVINIEFSAVTFQSPSTVKYRYKFQDKNNWEENNSHFLQFYSLPPGKYNLLVSAKKFNSDWSNPIQLVFIIKPIWYQSIYFKIGLVLVFLLMFILFFKYRINKIKEKENIKNEYLRKVAELEGFALSNQMNPHFIFNSLNTIQKFILEHNEREVLNYLSNFSVLIRQILDNSRKKYISIKSEIDFLHKYLSLEMVRFNDKFKYSIKHDADLVNLDYMIPPMLIQPLLENAIKHGMNKRDTYIEVCINIENHFYKVTVEDNGSGCEATKDENLYKGEKHQSTALKVLKERLLYTSDNLNEKGSISMLDKKHIGGRGTLVTMFIPINYHSND
ncbi:MAG: histidine kinase [Bacteroidetes bacterium]|nr:histidine kinase [Bacteroidota bacterium]